MQVGAACCSVASPGSSHPVAVACSRYGVAAAVTADGRLHTWLVDGRAWEDVYMDLSKSAWATPRSVAGALTFTSFLLGRSAKSMKEAVAPGAIDCPSRYKSVTVTAQGDGEYFTAEGEDRLRWGVSIIKSKDFANGELDYAAQVWERTP